MNKKENDKIKTEKELNKLLNALRDEIINANIYHQLYCGITNAQNNNGRAFNQSNTFWLFTIHALHEATIIRLCRIYDKQKSTISIGNILGIIESNLHLFDERYFLDRLKDNEYADSLALMNKLPSVEKLKAEIEYTSYQNPLVKKLQICRNNIIAHRGERFVLGEIKELENSPLSQNDIKDLLDTSFNICNYYLDLYQAATFSRQIVGHDDYKTLLKFINLGLDKWDEDIDREVTEYNLIQRKRGAVITKINKTQVTMDIDDDLLEIFRELGDSSGKGYQTVISDALREYLDKVRQY